MNEAVWLRVWLNSPFPSCIYKVSLNGETPDSKPGDDRFDPYTLCLLSGSSAVERYSVKVDVAGSNPARTAMGNTGIGPVVSCTD